MCKAKRRAFALLNLIPLTSATAEADYRPDTERHCKHNCQNDKRGNVGKNDCRNGGTDQKTDNCEKQNSKNAGHCEGATRSLAQITGIIISHKKPSFIFNLKGKSPFHFMLKPKVGYKKAFGSPKAFNSLNSVNPQRPFRRPLR